MVMSEANMSSIDTLNILWVECPNLLKHDLALPSLLKILSAIDCTCRSANDVALSSASGFLVS